MERAGATARAVRDDGELRGLLQRPVVATIWANRPDPTPREIGSKVREITAECRGLPAAAVTDIEARLGEALRVARGVVLAVSEERVEFVESLDEPVRSERVVFGTLPALAPVVEHRQTAIPFVAVAMDRRGADVAWTTRSGDGSRTITGDDTYITKVQAGGWSHKTYHQRAENTWEHTAKEIAAELERIVRDIDARLVVVASEERMGEMLRNHLGDETRALLRDVSGSRTRDGSDAERERDVRRWVRTAVAEDTVAALQLFAQERGQLDRAADGAEATFAALRESRVDTLLLHDDGSQDRTAFYDTDDATVVALDRTTFEQLGRPPGGVARMHDVAIRACVLTGAGIRIVPEHSAPNEGIGAILRW